MTLKNVFYVCIETKYPNEMILQSALKIWFFENGLISLTL